MSTLRFVAHLADLHIGAAGRDEELERVCEWIADDAREHGVGLIVIAGDLYDRRSTPEERLTAARILTRLASVAPVVIVEGNHCARRDIDLLRELKAEHEIHVATHHEALLFLGVQVVCLPWPRKGDLVSPADLRDCPDVGELAMARLADRFTVASAEISGWDMHSIVVAHADVPRGSRSRGNPETGEDLVIPAAWFSGLGASYVALGHEHARQEVAPGCWYSGSPRRTTFGEAEPKGYNLVELSHGEPARVTFRETPCAPMVLLEATWQGEDQVLKYTAHEPVAPGAEVRLRYVATEDHRAGARAEAEREKKLLIEGGAVNVILDEKPIMIYRRREENGSARARSTWEKVVAWLDDTKQAPEAERRVRLELLLDEISRGAGVPGCQSVPAAVRVDALRVRGIGCFREEVAIDFHSIPGRVVAVTGANGSGKSTLLGLIPGAMYRSHPDFGDLLRRAHGRDALVEADLTNGENWRLRLSLNGEKRKSEAWVFCPDGSLASPDLSRGLATAFDRWVADHLPPPELYLGSTFAAQRGKGDPIEAKPAELHALLSELLGLGYLEKLAESTRLKIRRPGKRGESPTGLEVDAERLAADLAAARARAGDIGVLQGAFEGAMGRAEAARLALVRLEEEAAAAERRRAEWSERLVEIRARGEVARASLDAAVKLRDEKARLLTDAHARLAQAEARLRDLRDRLADADLVAAAVAYLPRMQHDVEAARAEEDRAELAWRESDARCREAREAEQTARRELQQVKQRVEQAMQAGKAAMRRVGDAERAAADLPDVEQAARDLTEAERARDGSHAERERVEQAIRASEKWDRDLARRIEDATRGVDTARRDREQADEQAALLPTVPCKGEGAFAACGFLGRAVKARDRLPVIVEAIERGAADVKRIEVEPRPDGYVDAAARQPAVRATSQAAADAERAVSRLTSQAARLADLQRAAAGASAAREELARAEQATVEATAAVKPAERTAIEASRRSAELWEAHEAADRSLSEAGKANERAHRALAGTERIAASAPAIEQARSDLAAAEQTLGSERAVVDAAGEALSEADRAKREAAEAREAVAAEWRAHEEAKPPATDPCAVQAARATVEQAVQREAVAKAAVEQADRTATEADCLEEEHAEAAGRLADACLLADALGRDGVQAMEVDLAAPAISDLVNDLLGECWGSRFAVGIETQQESADGKRVIEGLAIRVLDVERGTNGEAREILSGGERVIVGEAVRLATAIYAVRSAGLTEAGTLVRDEYGAALSEENGRRYVAMLRRAAGLGNFAQVLYVSHSQVMQDAADARVHLEDGRVEVRV